jgi:hypothetical protein
MRMPNDFDVSALDDITVHALWCALLLQVDEIHIDPPTEVWDRLEELKDELTVEWDRRNGYLEEGIL